MPKKPSKTGPRAASKASSRRLPMAATKRPPASAEDGTTERIARALEAIAAQLSAASAIFLASAVNLLPSDADAAASIYCKRSGAS